MEKIKISTPYIKLDQLLKFANIVNDGSDAKYLIYNECVSVNGEIETRRGRKLYPNDTVKIVFEEDCFELKVCE